MSKYERPLAFRRMQLQLMTPERVESELEFLNENVRNVQQHSYSPVCGSYIKAIQEVEQRLATGKSHFDPELFEEAQRAAEARLGTVGGVSGRTRVDPRVWKSHVLESYFRLVPEDWETDWQPELARLAQTAMRAQAKDRQRWEEAAEAEANRLRAEAEERRKKEQEARGE